MTAYASTMSFFIRPQKPDPPDSPEALFHELVPRDSNVRDLLLRQGDALRAYHQLGDSAHDVAIELLSRLHRVPSLRYRGFATVAIAARRPLPGDSTTCRRSRAAIRHPAIQSARPTQWP